MISKTGNDQLVDAVFVVVVGGGVGWEYRLYLRSGMMGPLYVGVWDCEIWNGTDEDCRL